MHNTPYAKGYQDGLAGNPSADMGNVLDNIAYMHGYLKGKYISRDVKEAS